MPIHAVLLPDGRVMSYGTRPNGTQTAYYEYDVWNPAAGTGTDRPHAAAQHHADGHLLQLPDRAAERRRRAVRRGQPPDGHEHPEPRGDPVPSGRPHAGAHGTDEPTAVVLVGDGAAQRRGLRPGREWRRRPARAPQDRRHVPAAHRRVDEQPVQRLPEELGRAGRARVRHRQHPDVPGQPGGERVDHACSGRSRPATPEARRPPSCSGRAASCRSAAAAPPPAATPTSSTSTAAHRGSPPCRRRSSAGTGATPR